MTALAYDMTTMVAGRFLQGVGGGGLVPATLALVADLYPVERRGVPLGVVSAVQEIGSVLGPLFGALVLAVADWRVIFLVNLVVGLVLAAPIRWVAPASREPRARPLRLAGAALLLLCWWPAPWSSSSRALLSDVTWGAAFIPVAGQVVADPGRRGRHRRRCAASSPAATARRPLVDLRGWGATTR